jgi:uncharacterized protein YdaU (DUF1376 family)
LNYWQRHIGDYARDTAHLSMHEDGAYGRMLDLYYATERALPLERVKLYRLLRAVTKQDKIVADSVLLEFFVEEFDGWHHKRCDAELVKAIEEGEENQARKENERERQRRSRTRRKELFDALRERGIVPKWDMPIDQLETLLSQAGHAPVTRDSHGAVPSPEPDPLRVTNNHKPITNNQEPVTSNQEKEKPIPPTAGAAPSIWDAGLLVESLARCETTTARTLF